MVNCDNQDANKWILNKPSIRQFQTVVQLVDSQNEEDWENAFEFIEKKRNKINKNKIK